MSYTYFLNTPTGGTTGHGNTGIAPQQIDFKRIKGFFIMPEDAYLTAAEILALEATLQSKTILDSRTARYYPVYGVTDFASADTAPQEWTSGYAEKEMTGDGTYNFTVTFRRGGVMRHANLRQFNDETVKVALLDDAGTLWGTKDGNGYFSGFTTKMYTPKFTLAGNSDPSLYLTNISLLEPGELNDIDKLAYIVTDKTINFEKTVPGVVNIYLKTVSVANDEWIFQVFTQDGNVNMYDDYSTELADPDNFTLTDNTGAAVTITGITTVSATKSFDLNPATAAGIFTLAMVGPASLAANSIGGAPDLAYECYNTITETLPAP